MMEDKTLKRIISAAYNDCGFVEKQKVKLLVRKDPEAKKVFESYRASARVVHSIREEECPALIPEKALRVARTSKFQAGLFSKPAAAFAIIFAAVVIGIFNLVNHQEKTYTTAEIRNAERKAEESLALVGRILNRTTSTLGNQILPEKVSKPVKKGLNVINNLFIGG